MTLPGSLPSEQKGLCGVQYLEASVTDYLGKSKANRENSAPAFSPAKLLYRLAFDSVHKLGLGIMPAALGLYPPPLGLSLHL